MSETNLPVVPKINDSYWFNYSENLLNGAEQKRDAAAAAIQKLVVWLWGIYTASAAVGFTLSGKELSFWPTFIVAAASGALIIVYWGTVWVQVPITVEFDARSPTEIREVYKKIISGKSLRLGVTLFLSVIAAVMVSVALVTASVSKPAKQDITNVQTGIDYINGKSVVSVTAWVGETKRVSVSASQFSVDGKKQKPVNVEIIPTREGLLQTSLQISDKPVKDLLLTLEWQTKNANVVTVARKVKTE